jgi:pimeloyl-ACP methyl ester carboxylesterase
MTQTAPRPGVDRAPVDGGRLAFEVLPGTTVPVLAIHGISSQRKLWSWLRAAAPEITLIAPDLRGRADSLDVTGGSSIARHADDMVVLLDHLGVDRVHVCGMSMGAFVGVQLATRHRARVATLTLIDGGFPMPAPPGLTREMLPVVFADRLGRLRHRWATLAEYMRFVENTAPMLDPADPLLVDYLAHDLADGLVRLSQDALLSDAEDVYFGENHWQELDVPVRFAHAQWSVGRGSAPGYPADAVSRYQPATVMTRYLEGLDHAASIMTPAGAAAVAALLREALR